MSKIPETVLEAVAIYVLELEHNDGIKARLANVTHSELASQEHHFSTMNLRNRWMMWDRETPLVKSAVATYGLVHADDLSGIIVHGALAKYRKQDYIAVMDEQAARYKEYWKSRGYNPATMERLPK